MPTNVRVYCEFKAGVNEKILNRHPAVKADLEIFHRIARSLNPEHEYAFKASAPRMFPYPDPAVLATLIGPRLLPWLRTIGQTPSSKPAQPL